jgi:hypothetical protein
MAPSTFVLDPLFFSDPDGICGLNMAKTAGFSLGDMATGLIPLVFSGRPTAPSKVKLQFGHHVTKTISNHHRASSSLFYSQSSVDFNSTLKTETGLWNPPAEASLKFSFERLRRLQSSPVGGLLLILIHWNSDTQSFGEPVVPVVACPAVATLGHFGKCTDACARECASILPMTLALTDVRQTL